MRQGAAAALQNLAGDPVSLSRRPRRRSARVRPFTPTIVVLEATGGYEVTVAAALAGARLPVAVINPRQIRDFARATG